MPVSAPLEVQQERAVTYAVLAVYEQWCHAVCRPQQDSVADGTLCAMP